ncbi:RecB family exonuclease [plant metagenome]|uniref:RecB family exonuclease n=1 Tax=plant metagenome TaxID=1297885 RepID=A0A484RYW6_9ZZZZ
MQPDITAWDLPGISRDGLADLPPADTLVLTVNNRHARRLVTEWVRHLNAEKRVAELPRIVPLSAWLEETAHALTFLPQQDVPAYRLSSFAAQALWTDVIRRAEADQPLLDATQAARLAMEADTLADEWAVRVPEGMVTDEYRSFLRWRAAYRARLGELDAEDANQGYAGVLQALEQRALPAPGHVVMAGFATPSPRLRRLALAFAEGGAQVLRLDEEENAQAVPRRCQPADRGAEWRQAAAWAARQLAASPEGRYAIVSPKLEEDAPLARRVLARALADGDEGASRPFNVAVAPPLAEWPAVRAAMAWLSALADMTQYGACETRVLGAALLAGHCAGAGIEQGARAALDVRWRRRGIVRLNAQDWEAELIELQATRLQRAWRDAVAAWQDGPRRVGADLWARRLRAALAALGFPGPSPLDSTGFQVLAELGESLDRYAALSPATGKLDGAAAVQLLARLARNSPFQPQRDPNARLDVLGLLEAEGGRWDGVWVLGLTDDVLPAAPRPNPLLPLPALRQAQAPRATPERERQWAEDMYATLLRAAPHIVVSCAQREGERDLRPSPLIAGLPDDAGLLVQEAQAQALPVETFQDARGPALAQGAQTTGGLDVLDTQARNPLWAFARHRLGARAMQPYAEPGAMNVRGQFLHEALEILWDDLRDQDGLHAAMAGGTLAASIDAAVTRAAHQLIGYGEALRALECARARVVLANWLAIEAQRLPFAVAQIEQAYDWQRGPLSLSLRLDRMDTLPDGSRVILDYKTGGTPGRPLADWARARPVNLQLPFYAAVIAREEGADVAGLLLAQIHARQVAVQGMADTDLGLEGVAVPSDAEAFGGLDWQGVLAHWRAAIETLADEFAQGVADNVAWRADDLTYCDAQPFLRLDLELDEDGGDD